MITKLYSRDLERFGIEEGTREDMQILLGKRNKIYFMGGLRVYEDKNERVIGGRIAGWH